MAVPPGQHRGQDHERHVDDDEEVDDFTFPTPPPPPQFKRDRAFHHLPCSPSPPVWLHLSSPIRRSFSAADCAASPWRDRASLVSRRRRGGVLCSPALSDCAGFGDGEEEEEGEERMDSLWEDLNDEDEDMLFGCHEDVSRRRSVGGAKRAGRAGSTERDVLGASRSSRRRSPGLVVMMRALKKMFVAHKGKSSLSRVHKDEQSTAASATASPSPSPCMKR